MQRSFLSFLYWQSGVMEDSSGSNGRGGGHREETAQGEKCEPLAPVAAQSERQPMWKSLTVNSPLRWAWSRGNASQSPACSPTWEQLQSPSASSSWRLPEGSAPHPSISGEKFLCHEWGISVLEAICVNRSHSLFRPTDTGKGRGSGGGFQSAKLSMHSRDDFNYDLSQILLINRAREHLCHFSSAFSNSLHWSTDAEKCHVMFMM